MSNPASNLLDFILEKMENLPDDLQDSFLMIGYKDTLFEASRRLLLKKRSFLLKQQQQQSQQQSDQEQLLLLRKKLEKENKRANSYIDEKIAYTEKLHNNVNYYLKLLDEGLQAIEATSPHELSTSHFRHDNEADDLLDEYDYDDYLEERIPTSRRSSVAHSQSASTTMNHRHLNDNDESSLLNTMNSTTTLKSTTSNPESKKFHSHHPHHHSMPSSSSKATLNQKGNSGLSGHQRILKASQISPFSTSCSISDPFSYGAAGNNELQEPVYCICRQVSYGDMIGCDNAECAIEWFHYACVGLSAPPKGKWFCPECTQKLVVIKEGEAEGGAGETQS